MKGIAIFILFSLLFTQAVIGQIVSTYEQATRRPGADLSSLSHIPNVGACKTNCSNCNAWN